jgi:hypothetical protein
MITFEKLGDAEHVTPEFIRAWCWATRAVLGFHNMTQACFGMEVLVTTLERPVAGLMTRYPHGRDTAITAPLISLDKRCRAEGMATVIVHEFIHAMCGDFGEGTDEKCASTLTAKLKPEVQVLADQLLEGTYRRAAFIAHTKMSYKATGEDHYDDSQYDFTGVMNKYADRGK